MFTQKITMDCTKEQYEKYLKDELLKMGYEERTGYWKQNDVISNNHNSEHGLIGNTYSNNRNIVNRTYLGSFNAELFLALAAMTDKVEGNYGEYVIVLRSGRIYKMDEEDKLPPESTLIRKATKEEIMAVFGEKNNEKQMVGAIINDTINNCNKIHEIALAWNDFVESLEGRVIDKLKSKGYKILKPKTWEEA